MRCGDKKAGSLTYSILSDNWYVIVLRHRDVLVRGYVHDVVISCGAEVIARHPRCHDFIFDPLHYLALIEQKINALDHETTLILDPAGTHYVYDLHRCNHRVSFKGAFRTETELRAACSYIPSSLPGVWSHDLLIQLPGGGSVRCAYGVQVMEKLVARCRDLKEGWYAPGWTEPADYDPVALTAPLVDPSPAMDALYVWQAGSSPIFDRAGEPFEIFGAAGEPLEIVLKEVA